MGLFSSITNSFTKPFRLIGDLAQAITPVAAEALKFVAGTFFEGGKLAAGAMQMMGMTPFGNPIQMLAGQLMGQSAQNMQNLTFSTIDNIVSQITGRPVQMPYGQQYPGQMYMPPLYDRMAQQYGFPGQYGQQMIQQQFPPQFQQPQFQQQFPIAGAGPQFGGPVQQTFGATAGGAPVGGTFASSAQTPVSTGFIPTGNSNMDLVNTIANAPLFSAEESALMAKLPPEQQAMMQLQARKQREALMTSILTNIMNMKHESLKQISQNLRA